MTQNHSKPAALLSVSDKQGIASFAKRLVDSGYVIISTGNTAKVIADDGVPVTTVSEITEFPEIMDGRVKTLHPRIHGGLLGDRSKAEHVEAMEKYGIADIKIVCVNLYPFQKVTEKSDVSLDVAVENIDIGGPAMIRASAKNFENVAVVCDTDDYNRIAEVIEKYGEIPLDIRKELSLKAFKHTRDYDTAICAFFDEKFSAAASSSPSSAEFSLPKDVDLNLVKTKDLRYGENPHQAAALFQHRDRSNPTTQILADGFEQLNGKELSYNNLVDLDAAIQLVAEFEKPTAAVIKHTNPAGCASADSITDAFDKALACDPVSAFGGIVALNRNVDQELAKILTESFYEIVSAPGFDDDALEILNKKKNLRVIRQPQQIQLPPYAVRATTLGFLLQSSDPIISSSADYECVTEKKPTDEEFASLVFAQKVCKHVKSNAIVLAKGTRTIGIGAGQMSRIDSVEVAAKKAKVELAGAVLASDAFFPFRDGPDAAAQFGITAIIQPGGSRRDQEVIDACNEHGIAMIFTGKRHFRH